VRWCWNLYATAALFFISAWLAAASPAWRSHPPAQGDKIGKPAVQAGVLAPDKGKFRILLNGQVVGSEEFEVSSSGGTWTARGSTTIRNSGGAEVKATGQLKLAVDGAPIHYEWSAQAQKKASGSVEFTNGTAKSKIDLGGNSPVEQHFTFPTPRVAVLDNNLYDHYALLAQLYDWKAGGKQDFPVLIPQDVIPGSISVESLGPQQVDNAKYEGLRVSTTDLEILLYLDAAHRLMRMDVPSSKVTILRE
jgi:hypothetical protein